MLTAVLIGATLVLQAVGIRALFGVAEDAARAEATIGALEPRVVVSDLFFLPEMTPRLFFAKQWLYVKNDTELRELTGLLREKGIDRFTLVLSALPVSGRSATGRWRSFLKRRRSRPSRTGSRPPAADL